MPRQGVPGPALHPGPREGRCATRCHRAAGAGCWRRGEWRLWCPRPPSQRQSPSAGFPEVAAAGRVSEGGGETNVEHGGPQCPKPNSPWALAVPGPQDAFCSRAHGFRGVTPPCMVNRLAGRAVSKCLCVLPCGSGVWLHHLYAMCTLVLPKHGNGEVCWCCHGSCHA